MGGQPRQRCQVGQVDALLRVQPGCQAQLSQQPPQVLTEERQRICSEGEEQRRLAEEEWRHREREREEPDDASSVTGVFLRSGTAEKKGYKVSPQAAKILEDQGRTLEHAEKLTARTEVDKESGHRITKFSKQVGSFFRDMGLEPVKRVLGERPRGQGQQQPPRK